MDADVDVVVQDPVTGLVGLRLELGCDRTGAWMQARRAGCVMERAMRSSIVDAIRSGRTGSQTPTRGGCSPANRYDRTMSPPGSLPGAGLRPDPPDQIRHLPASTLLNDRFGIHEVAEPLGHDPGTRVRGPYCASEGRPATFTRFGPTGTGGSPAARADLDRCRTADLLETSPSINDAPRLPHSEPTFGTQPNRDEFETSPVGRPAQPGSRRRLE